MCESSINILETLQKNQIFVNYSSSLSVLPTIVYNTSCVHIDVDLRKPLDPGRIILVKRKADFNSDFHICIQPRNALGLVVANSVC